MAGDLDKLTQHILNIYDRNPFVALLDMKVVDVREGRTEIQMPVLKGKHTNLYGIAHGGAIASLADTAMGVACTTLGKIVVTIDMNINYIKGAEAQHIVTAIGTVIHHGQNTMVAEAELCGEAGALLAKARGTFYIMGKIELDAEDES